jgi:aryl-alcohol dehydrogenase-like predicted oxidoreductase
MEYRTLGKTGLKVSVFGIGSWQLSGPLVVEGQADGFPDLGRDAAISLIQACGDLGINLIDTAEIYGDGEGERRIGLAIAKKRDRWILSSKFGLRRGNNGERIINPHPETIRNSLEGSLSRLNTDYIDIYLYHAPPQPEWIESGKAILETLKEEGKIRFYGISTENACELKSLVDSEAVEIVSFAQSLINNPQKILNLAKNQNLGIIIRGALAAGQLSGKYFRQSPQLSSNDFRYHLNFDWNKYRSYEKLIPEGASMTALALRYLLDLNTTQTILIGGKSLANYQEALKALKLSPLEAKTRFQLERARYWQSLLRRISRIKGLIRSN